jgi:RecA-family ATPase
MIYSLQKILTATQNVPHVCYPLLPKGGILVIGAPAKTRKSYFAIHLAYCLATGNSFLGFKIEKAQRVLYIEKEIGVAGMRDRAEQVHRRFGDAFAEDNLFFLPKSRSTRNLFLGSDTLKSIVEQHNPDVIVLDPLRRFHRADEDSSGEMEKVFDQIEELQDDNRRSVILIHHCGKPQEHRAPEDPASLRGSSFIFDAGDSYAMLLRANRQSDNYKVHFTFRHTADRSPMSARFEDGIFEKSGGKDE